jgi:glutamate carboxypeptidase
MINLLKEIVHLESPSSDKKAVDKCSSFVRREFRKIGAAVTRYEQKEMGDLHLVEYPASKQKRQDERILILTHIDTVWPVGKIQDMPFYISGNKLFGPGVLDMKAGIVMVMYSLKTINELNIKPQKSIAIFINSAEEIGAEASDKMIRDLARKSACVLCVEPSLPGGGLKMQRKGRLVMRLDTKGKPAHASEPEKGVNAIDELMHQLRLIQRLKSRSTTINIGLIQGGEKVNIVAEKASATLDFRFWKTLHKENIMNFMKNLESWNTGARISSTVESLTPPMERTDASSKLFSQIKNIASSSLSLNLTGGKASGGSDASTASTTGVPTVDGLGPDGEGIHAENEHLLLPSFIERTALLTELMIQL